MSKTLYRYRGTPDGPSVAGVPLRDITERDMGRIALDALQNGVTLGIYTPVKAPDATTTTAPPDATKARGEK